MVSLDLCEEGTSPKINNCPARLILASAISKAVIVVCGPPKCLHQFVQALRRSVEALAGINFFDFNDAAATPT